MFRAYSERAIKDLMAVLPVSSTVTGFVSSSDVGKLVYRTSNQGGLLMGSTADLAHSLMGIVASVPQATTPASTVPFYVMPLVPNAKYEADFSTTYSTALPATTDIGKYCGISNTTTVAGGSYISMATLGNAWGTTSGNFFRIDKSDVSRRVVVGTFVPHYIDGYTS